MAETPPGDAAGILLVETEGGVTTLRLNRPAQLNALTRPLLAALAAALEEIADGARTRCVVLTGMGRAFCAGQSLDEVSTGSELASDVRRILEDGYVPVIRRLRQLEVPVIAAVNGVAAGSGLSLALACDLRWASELAVFSCAFSRVGLVPDAGATHLLPRVVGWPWAMEMALTGRRLDAAEALRVGLVHRVVPAAELETAVARTAADLAAGPTIALGLTKRALDAADGAGLEAQLALETELQVEAAGTRDAAEGIAAFLAKRPPDFGGT